LLCFALLCCASLSSGSDFVVQRANRSLLSSTAREFENTELIGLCLDSLVGEQICKSAAARLEFEILLGMESKSEFDFLASHFDELRVEKLANPDFDVLHAIIAIIAIISLFLLVNSSEDSLYEFISTQLSSDDPFRFLIFSNSSNSVAFLDRRFCSLSTFVILFFIS
jgi:hypothetical protein